MRVGTSTMYSSFTRYQESAMEALNTVNNQLKGTKIDYGYQNTDVFIQTLRLDQKEYTLTQNSQASQTALQFAQNTDSTMTDMTSILTSFKTKLVNAATESNTLVSRKAIAQEMKGLMQNLITLGNTSINGQYLFSGSSFTTKPLDDTGAYYGNAEKVKSLVNAGVEIPYNQDGFSLFYGSESDYSRVVTTNVPKKNERVYYDVPSVDRYVTKDDYVSDLTGNNGDGSKSYFYITGAQSDGTTFKQMIDISNTSKVSDLLEKIKDAYKGNVDVSLNDHGQIEVKDLQSGSSKLQFHMVGSDNSTALTKATAGFNAGSTVLTLASTAGIVAGDKLNIEGIGQVKVTGVGVPAAGQITFSPPLSKTPDTTVTSLNVKKVHSTDTTAAAAIAVGANTINVDSTNGLAVGDKISLGHAGVYTITALAANTITFNATSTATVSSGDEVTFIADVDDLPSKGVTVSEFVRSGMGPLSIGDNTASNDYWDHSSFNFGIEFRNRQTGAVSESQELLNTALGGTPTGITLNGNAHAFALGAASTVRDFVTAVQGALDTEFGVNKFSATLENGKLLVKDKSITADTADTASSQLVTMTLNAPANTFAATSGIESSKASFAKEGNTLTASVPQILKSDNSYAKPTTKLVDVAGVSTLVGETLQLNVTTVNGTNETVTINFGAAGSTFTVASTGNVYNIINAASPQATTPADSVTYQQLMDVMSMATSGSYPATVTPAAPTAAQATDYNNAVSSAQKISNVTISDTGVITLKDKLSANTQMTLAMFDTGVNSDFYRTAQINTDSVVLNSNNAITVDDPYVSFFEQLQMAIDAVDTGKTRASDDGSDPRNIGIQNAITAIDHVLDHLIRKHTDVGATSNEFQLTHDRAESLKINVKTVKSEVLDTDIAEAYLELNQRMVSYQAMMSTVSKINGMSLVNYLS